jgi:ribose/xylose/arabinose/galactoside ABC-type transport system permease subunit
MTDAATEMGALATTPNSAPLTGGDERLAYRGIGQRLLIRPETVGVLASIVLYIFFWAVTKPFGNAAGVATVLDVAASPLGIMAIAVTALMIGGEFDLSSGAMTGAMAIIIVLLVKETGDLGGAGLSYWIVAPLSLLMALGIGWFNGWMVEKTQLPSFIVTLATFFVLRGFKLAGSKIIVDQIQVGRADEGKGYDFWRKVFGAEWLRQDHPFEARDAVFTVLAVLGGLASVLSLFEYSFRRSETRKPAGLVMFLLGLAGGAASTFLAHSLDGSDWLVMLVLAVSAIVATIGLCRWRYEPLDDRGRVSLGGSVGKALAIGVGSLALAFFFANYYSPKREEEVIPFVTEQGLRAILFMVLVGAAALYFFFAVYRSREVSPATKSATLAILAVITLGVALFVQSESQSPKFRTEIFSAICLLSLLFLVWAVASLLVGVRRFSHARSDGVANRLVTVGAVLVVLAITVKLLFVVQSEIDAKVPSILAKFSIRTLWFFAFGAVMTFVLRKTPFGSWVYAVGGNKQAARQVGVPAERTKKQLFMLVAGASWLVGMLLAFRLNTIQAGTGNGEEFEYIIAAVVGGTLLTGGFGSAIGAMIGAFIMAMAQQGPSFAGWNTDWRFVFLGIILLAAAFANEFVRKRAEALK